MQAVHDLVNYLNSHPEDLVALSALLSVVVMYGIRRIKALGKLAKAIMGVVAVPGVVTATVALTTSLHAESYPLVAVLGQILFHIYEAMKRNMARTTLAEWEPATAPLVETTTTPEY
jgi:hypothetical protein